MSDLMVANTGKHLCFILTHSAIGVLQDDCVESGFELFERIGEVQNADIPTANINTTGLGESFGMTTTAEGVETVEQFNILRAEGCTQVQGYLFSPPRPAQDVPLLLKELSAPQSGGRMASLPRRGAILGRTASTPARRAYG